MNFTKDQPEFDSIRSTLMHREKSTLLHSLLSILVRAIQRPFTNKKNPKRNCTRIERKEIQTVPTMNDAVLNRFKAIETRLTDLTTRLENVEKEITDLTTRLENVEKETVSLKGKVESLENFADEAVVYMEASYEILERMDEIATQGDVARVYISSFLLLYKKHNPWCSTPCKKL